MVTIQVSHGDLGRYLDKGITGAVPDLGLRSNGRPIKWLILRKNGLIDLKGTINGQVWKQTYRYSAPIDD